MSVAEVDDLVDRLVLVDEDSALVELVGVTEDVLVAEGLLLVEELCCDESEAVSVSVDPASVVITVSSKVKGN